MGEKKKDDIKHLWMMGSNLEAKYHIPRILARFNFASMMLFFLIIFYFF